MSPEPDRGIERRQEVRQETLDMVYNFIRRGIKERATDIHWEPIVDSGEEEIVVRFRVDGLLKDVERINHEKTRLGSLINAIKIMATMDPTKRRREQDGRFTFLFESVEYDVRVATMPTILGEKIVMRLMDRNKYCMSLDDLGMPADIQQSLDSMIYKPEGFVVISGPTGSGKTTSQYSILKHIYVREKNICTIEDPVEVKFPGINQIQVDHEFGMTFVSGLRAIMRQDPNIIAVGEIRDVETVRTALQAALAGSMIFSTLHARDAVNTIVRLLDMGVEPFFLATALTGVVTQRLVRLLCKICKGKGCMQCANVGYKKRTGIFELLRINETMRQLILNKASSNELRTAALEQGMIPFRKSIEPLIAQGLTTHDEVDRVLALE
ncbi:MAG: GspE/PulE family protein [Candidatus Omnitrophica bacterium]|nr:GspE/PulE family protein [Candidatus Omnitrophota bacterium]MDD5574385.1 GspE/PulE family protein [Candidatus Omnitrophota bacterium]